MLNEAIKYLNPRPGGKYIDSTLGGGNYTAAILEIIGNAGMVISFDLDKKAIDNAKNKFKKELVNKNLILINDNFKNLRGFTQKYSQKQQAGGFAGVVFDLGLSSDQLKDRDRGFSFQLDAPLDMSFAHIERIHTDKKRMDTNINRTSFIVNQYTQSELEKIIREYGEEKFARKIAVQIVRARGEKEIRTTKELTNIIKSAVPIAYRHKKIHFATKTFQALRIETNQELENLRTALPQALDLLKPGARIVVIAYHSLEDRIVKQFFKLQSAECICPPQAPVCQCGHKAQLKVITRKIITPSEEEIKANPRSRSAKMRVAEKI